MSSRNIGLGIAVLTVLGIATLMGAAFGESGDPTESLRAAELSFAASVASKDWQSFGNHVGEEAIFFAGRSLQGKEAILEAWSVYFQEEAPRLEWEPKISIVQEGGKLGFSRGPYTLTLKGEDGTLQSRAGEFISIWELQEDGSWQVIFDTGCPACQECDTE